MIILLAFLNLAVSLFIFYMVMRIYLIYGRDYILWFMLGIFLIPLLFLYSIFEYYISFRNDEIIYPVFVILIELMMIIGEKKLLLSIRAEEGGEYKILLREDMALLKEFERMANYLIGRISPLIGIKNIEDAIEECVDKYPMLNGVYITPDEKISTYSVEKNMEKVREEERIKMLCNSFSYLIERLLDMYAAFVPYEKIADDLKKFIGRIENTKITKWITPFAILKIVIEPLLRRCKADELMEIRISIVIEGINITKNGGIELHELYEYDYDEMLGKIIRFIQRLHSILLRLYGADVSRKITKNFRKLPNNIKEEMYKAGFIKYLPSGILEEEKLTLMSREKLIEELAERKRRLEEAYKRLAEAKLDRMKANFINIIAHELRTPLTVIKTYTDLLAHEKLGKLNKNQKEKVKSISKNIERMEELINDMLQIPSIDRQELELRKENFYIKDVLKDIVNELEEMAREKKQKMIVKSDDSMINGDIKLIEKALKNVISNSIKYTQEGGKIEITSESEGAFVHIKIKDNGIGIKKDELEKIFEPFFTGAHGGGMGLGLAIARSIIEGHDGRIWAESEVGKGTTFHILFRRTGR